MGRWGTTGAPFVGVERRSDQHRPTLAIQVRAVCPAADRAAPRRADAEVVDSSEHTSGRSADAGPAAGPAMLPDRRLGGGMPHRACFANASPILRPSADVFACAML